MAEAKFPMTVYVYGQSTPKSLKDIKPKVLKSYHANAEFVNIDQLVDAAKKYIVWAIQTQAREEEIAPNTKETAYKVNYKGQQLASVEQLLGELTEEQLIALYEEKKAARLAKEKAEMEAKAKEELANNSEPEPEDEFSEADLADNNAAE
jgi:hypothetical protein